VRKVKLLLFSITIFLIFGCGEESSYVDEDVYSKEYDMWVYLTPENSYDIKYAVYENGEKTDYFYETTKVLESGIVQRVSGDETTTLIPYDDVIKVEEPDGTVVEIQRHVKIGDTNIFHSSTSNLSCKADDYFLSIVIKGVEFYQVMKVSCITDDNKKDIYYGYNEGIVAIHKEESGVTTDIVKVDEVRLQ
jgi:hypothetical protein